MHSMLFESGKRNVLEMKVSDLNLSDWEDVPQEALDVLASDAEWVQWARELVPELIDLKARNVRDGYFADWGTAQGLIWDALEAVSNTPSEDFVKRIFEFVCRCAEVDDYELHNPARIGFLCKVAHTEGGSMTPDELGHRLSSRLIDANKELFSFHYGLDGFNRMKAANSGQRRQ